MKYITVICTIAFVAGCASTPTPTIVEINKPSGLRMDSSLTLPKNDPYDVECAGFAKQAARIAELRDADIAADDIPIMMDLSPSYPAGPMIREVFSRPDVNPVMGARNAYAVCYKRGYGATVQAMERSNAEWTAKQKIKLQQELDAKRPIRKSTKK